MLTIGLDLGTTGCKAVALSDEGQVVATASRTYPLIQALPGQGEQDARAVWSATLEALTELAAKLPKNAVTALAFSAAMHSMLPVDVSGEPLFNALTWADARPGEMLGRFNFDPLWAYGRTGCPLQAAYHPAKLLWLRENHLEVVDRAWKFVTIKDYVAFKLTGVWATDRALAAATGWLNLEHLEWDRELLEKLELEPSKLLPILDGTEVLGNLLPQIAEQTGLPANLVVRAGSSDGGLANLGAGVGIGQAVITVGTSAALRQMTQHIKLDPLARTWCYVLAGRQYFAGGAINNAGLLLEWIRQSFYPEYARSEGFERLFAEAVTVEPGADGVILLPYLTGERSPLWRSDLSATLHGLQLRHGRPQVAQAALESVAFCLAQLWDLLCPELDEVKVTGSIAQSRLWLQILADVLGVRLLPVDAADASAMGAALMARGTLEAMPFRTSQAIEPNLDNQAVYLEQKAQFSALYQRVWG